MGKMNILIADDDIDLATVIDVAVRNRFNCTVKTHICNSSNTAIDLLKNQQIDLCISDHNMTEGNGNKILEYIITNKLNIKFVSCTTENIKQMPIDYPHEHIFFAIVKPHIVAGIKDLVTLMQEENLGTINSIENDYIPVTLEFLFLLEKTPSDIYLRISDSKFIKCLNENEPFTIEDNAKYLCKSVSKLYLKKSSNQNVFTKILSDAINKIMLKENIPLNEKMSIAHAQLCDVIKFTGLTEELAGVIKENIVQSVSIIMKNKLLNYFWKEMNFKGEYSAKLYMLHAMLASVIIKKLDWNSEETMLKLTLAAFLQDVTLKTLPVMKIYDHQHFLEIKNTLSRDEVRNFLEHPLYARNLIEDFKEIPHDTARIIFQHHEMPDGSGFPCSLNADKLEPLSCVFILSGLLARTIINEDKEFEMANFIERYEKVYNKGNFKDSFKVLQNM